MSFRTGIIRTAAVTATLAGCCCAGRVELPAPQRAPLPGALSVSIPSEVVASSDTITEATMRNVLFHLDDDIRLRIHRMRGQLRDLSGHHVVVLDDKKTMLLAIEKGEVGLSARDLTLLLNRYVFGYRGSPLKNLVVHTQGTRIVQTGVMHKIIDIPFEMTAELSVTGNGLLRVHTTAMRICGLDGKGLLQAVDKTLADLLDLRGAHGVRVEGNDLLMDILTLLPPPAITGRLTDVRVVGDEIVQIFGSVDGAVPAELDPPADVQNYVFFRGGTIRFGKLFMPAADLLTIDGDAADAFDFYLDYYSAQLTAGYSVTLPDRGLATYMPDFDDIGTSKGQIRAK